MFEALCTPGERPTVTTESSSSSVSVHPYDLQWPRRSSPSSPAWPTGPSGSDPGLCLQAHLPSHPVSCFSHVEGSPAPAWGFKELCYFLFLLNFYTQGLEDPLPVCLLLLSPVRPLCWHCIFMRPLWPVVLVSDPSSLPHSTLNSHREWSALHTLAHAWLCKDRGWVCLIPQWLFSMPNITSGTEWTLKCLLSKWMSEWIDGCQEERFSEQQRKDKRNRGLRWSGDRRKALRSSE